MEPTDTTRQSFKLHLPGLLKVLAEHLYSNRQVAVRELIQNAHDSCTRRQLRRDPEDGEYWPAIHLRVAPERRTLIIEDNGCGLTEAEIVDYLATIGRSYTRETKESLGVLAPDDAAKLIGQFGFGFLSAFLLASEVTLTTRSIASGASAIRWRAGGDEFYEMTSTERATTGTTIELVVKPEASFVLQPHLLEEMVRQFADFLPIPIYLGDDPVPLNLGVPPWEAHDPRFATLAFIERAFGLVDPLCVIPLRDHRVPLENGDAISVSLRGFLFVPAGSTASIREYGDLWVYIRQMFIRQNDKHLLPPWAKFVRGVVDCPDLQPTASREDIHQDAMFEAVQQAIEAQLIEGLREIAQHDPATWRKIVTGHQDVLMGWTVRDDDFFAQVADLVVFRTSRGLMALPEYLSLTDGTIYYVTREMGSLQEQLLAEGHGVPVIDASWFAVTPFLEKYARRHDRIRLIRLDGDEAGVLFRPVGDADTYAALAILLDFYDRRGVRASVAAFRPHEAPALMIYPESAELVLEGREAIEAGEIPEGLAGLISEYVEDIAARQPMGGTLLLNASCPLIRRLTDLPAGPARDAVLIIVYQTARLFAGRTLTVGDVTEAFAESGAALGRLLES